MSLWLHAVVLTASCSNRAVYRFLRACPNATRILAYEPQPLPFQRLSSQVTAELSASHGRGPTPIVELRNLPLSDSNRTVALVNQPGAGDNTGSIEPGLFSEPTMSRNATFMRSSTLDDELSRRGLGDAEVLILKIDVEGQ